MCVLLSLKKYLGSLYKGCERFFSILCTILRDINSNTDISGNFFEKSYYNIVSFRIIAREGLQISS